MDTTRPILVGIDGGKALHAAVMAVFDHPVIQRCQMHKLRNVADKLPDDLAAAVTKSMAKLKSFSWPPVGTFSWTRTRGGHLWVMPWS